MSATSPRSFWQTVLAVSVLLTLPAFYQTLAQINLLEIDAWHSRWTFLLAAYVLNLALGLGFLYLIGSGRANSVLALLEAGPASLPRPVGILIFLLGLAGFPATRLFVLGSLLPQLFPSLWLFWWFSLLQAAGIRVLTRHAWPAATSFAILFQGLLFISYGFLWVVTDYPFSIGYSEGSRFYYASLLFGKSIYGIGPPLSFLHPTRYMLMSLPFLLKGLPLWAHRLWQALLWIGTGGLASLALVRRIKPARPGLGFLIGAWFFVFLFQGPVYYHLLVCVVVVLLGVDPHEVASVRFPWKSLLAVLAASFWAGMSRINWFPVPAILAIALYLLELPVSSFKNPGRYLLVPALWGVLGLATALLGQSLYIGWSRISDVSFFSSSFSSPLLWNRLWPNDIFAPGILPGIVLVSAAPLAAIFSVMRGHERNLHWLRILGLAGMLAVLFGGGLVVSTKIGGGADLHNLDAYLVLLGLMGAYLFAGRVAGEAKAAGWGQVAWPVIALACLIPLVSTIGRIQPPFSYPHAATQKDLAFLDRRIHELSAGGEVLFITERQLLTFQIIKGIPLVPDYEVVTLMEAAMSGNSEYLGRFYRDLHEHRFAVIIARRQFVGLQTDEPFAEENNAWDEMIAQPLLCEYQRAELLDSANVQLFVPRQDPADCSRFFQNGVQP